MLYSKNVVEAIVDFLIDSGWEFSFNSESAVFQFGLALKEEVQKILYTIEVRTTEFIVCAEAPLLSIDPADSRLMADLTEYILRVNSEIEKKYGYGCFQLDVDTGKLHFGVFTDCDGGIIPTENMIRNSIFCAGAAFMRFEKGFVQVLEASASPKSAFENCVNARLR